MKKKCLAGVMLILGIGLFGCDAANNTENTNEVVTIDREEETESVEDNKESGIVVDTGSAETVSTVVEGMAAEVQVVNYEIQPYNISYQLNEAFDVSEVKHNHVTYSNQNEDEAYYITMEVIEQTNLDKLVSNLQESFEADAYEVIGQLESTPSEENSLKGKMQVFAYPMIQGFYAYEIDEHVLAITYQYPVEAGDGMEPLLEAFRKSIFVNEER